MPFNTGMSLTIDPKQGVELLYGSTVKVWNFFSKNSLQPAAAIYFANCALYGGDSDGWRESLQTLTLFRSKQGFQFKAERPLSVGFPGADILPTLLNAEYGSRWLGVLFVLATIQEQDSGAHNLDRFVRQTASDPTRQFLLDRENCERLWTLSREIFAGCPYWYHFLKISSSILTNVNDFESIKSPDSPKLPKDMDLLSLIFPDANSIRADGYLSTIMTAGFDLWQLSQKQESKRKLLWARGGTGCAQLIFYLTVVCGFRVKIGTGDSNVVFGDSSQLQTEVVIQLVLVDIWESWETGYFFENEPIEKSVQRMLPDPSEEYDWRFTLNPNTKSSLSKYRGDSDTHFLGSPCFPPGLRALVEETKSYTIVPYVSHWFSDVIHNYSYYHLVYAGELASKDHLFGYSATADSEPWSPDHKSPLRAAVKSERLSRAIAILDPGILTNEDQEDLIRKIREMRKPDAAGELCKLIPRTKACLICDCFIHGDESNGMKQCRFNYYANVLMAVAQQIWICSYVSTNPEYLRDIGMNVHLNWNTICFEQKDTANREFHRHSLDTLLMAVSMRLAGQKVDQLSNCLGRVAGGFVVSVHTNEELAIFEDPGHSIYIIPGGITTQERRFRQVIQSTKVVQIKHPTELKGRMVFELTTSQDYFGDVQLKQEVHINSDTAVMTSALYQSCKRLYTLNPGRAIDRSLTVLKIDSCLDECVQNKLTESQSSRIAIVLPDRTYYTDPPKSKGFDHFGSMGEGDAFLGIPRCLTIVPAHRNVLLQRSVISQYGFQKVAILTGDCIHCAIQQSLEESMVALIC